MRVFRGVIVAAAAFETRSCKGRLLRSAVVIGWQRGSGAVVRIVGKDRSGRAKRRNGRSVLELGAGEARFFDVRAIVRCFFLDGVDNLISLRLVANALKVYTPGAHSFPR